MAATPMPKPHAMAIPKKDHNPAACADPSAAIAADVTPKTNIPLKLAMNLFFDI